VILLGAILALSSKKENKSLKSNRPAELHTYYYYPKANFYYDSTAGNYICWDSSAAEWKTTDKLPVQQEDLGKRVRIGDSPAPVWSENQNHRLIYSVSLYSDPKDFKKKEKPVVKDTAKSDSIIIADGKDEKKSGVKKFFERIFPPKKKKDS
jgi:hypothetical protein